MKEVNLQFSNMEDVQKFVSITSGFPERLELLPLDDDNVKVSGKSIVGIFSLECFKPLRFRIYADDDRVKEICDQLKDFNIR
ncbi:MAG: HPr family phosphocarrier protein [Oscillospiraceae bacterium]|nr:HPr family phosphocarrier protein [Oscillospiraceae bacterium]